MTPLELQDELVGEMSRILDGYTYKTPEGKRIPINVFAQNIPMNETDDEDDPIPYIIVRLNSGEDDGTRDSFNTVSIVVIVGIWDDALDAQGHRDVMNIIQKIYQRFHENPDLNRKAAYAGGFQWAMQDDACYPYSFGACHMKFHIA
ncbi:MAG: hypothetical protein NC305_18570, partial [Lachnospiraceae bacterium]|nr:hypothetical protein [Lachnospiraceae bacterium]